MSPILRLCKKIFAIEVLFIIGYNVLVYPYVNAKNESFKMGLTMYDTSLALVEQQGIGFTDSVAGQANNIAVNPNDANAAIFKAMGTPNDQFIATVVEKNIILKTGDGAGATKQIKVNKFQTGGSIGTNGKGKFSNRGLAQNLRIGATVHIAANDIPGLYTGAGTFRITYR